MIYHNFMTYMKQYSIYIYTYAYIYIYIFTVYNLNSREYVDLYIYMCMYIYIYIYILYIYTYICIYLYMHNYVHMYRLVYMCMGYQCMPNGVDSHSSVLRLKQPSVVWSFAVWKTMRVNGPALYHIICCCIIS